MWRLRSVQAAFVASLATIVNFQTLSTTPSGLQLHAHCCRFLDQQWMERKDMELSKHRNPREVESYRAEGHDDNDDANDNDNMKTVQK